MKKLVIVASALLALTACKPKPTADFIVTVTNDQTFDRAEEMVQIPMADLTQRVPLVEDEGYIVVDEAGKQVPFQITYDDQLLFPVTVKAKGTAKYQVKIGEPEDFATYVYGRHYPERVDDIAWENDRTAYRTYGPALQASGERAYGYDVWVKSVPGMVVEERYANELNPETKAEIEKLRKAGKKAEADALYHSVSYHVDHGNGLDCYKVGPTLGGGVAALLDGDAIVYPYCWKSYEILDNGPLRFTVKLQYNPLTVKKDSAVVETRLISLDKGSQLNRTTLSYEGLSQTTPVASGIVIHPENPTAYVLAPEKGYVAYQDLTDNINNDNGQIYLGMVVPGPLKEAKTALFSPKELKEHGGALGHVLAVNDYKPGTAYTYYWGSGWSKFGFTSMEEWSAYLGTFALQVKNPLKVTY